MVLALFPAEAVGCWELGHRDGGTSTGVGHLSFPARWAEHQCSQCSQCRDELGAVGVPSPGTPTHPHLSHGSAPRAPHPTDPGPPARATPPVLAAPGGTPGHLHPLRGRGCVGRGLLIPVGSRIWDPHHTRELPAPTNGIGKGNAPHIPCWGISQGLGAPLGLPCSSSVGLPQFHPTVGSVRILGRDPAVAILCTSSSWIWP